MASRSPALTKDFPRSALVWLLVSITSVMIPLQMHIPLWTSLVFILVVAWRWLMHLGRLPFPTTMIKIIVVTLGISAVIISTKGRFHLEGATTFILVASLLKVLEIKTQRDGYIVIFLSFFLLGVSFLYDQGILAALYSLIVVWLLISALVGLHQTLHRENEYKQLFSAAGKTSVQVLALSLPIMLVLFILFPRLGPLWSLNLQSSKAKTGLSEEMSPGDIAELSKSDELVFRVTFDKQPPAADTWYWRGLVLDRFKIKNGRAVWSSSGVFDQIDWYPQSWQPEMQEGVYDYRITQEASDHKWLFGLRGVAAMESGIGMKENDLITSNKKLYQRKEYRVRSQPTIAIADQGLRPFVRNQSLQLVDSSNPKSRLLAQQIMLENTSDQARVDSALNYYQANNFVYTLKPIPMQENDIDSFLFDNRAGFCAHFSSSFVFMMRSMNIPARVVSGYQGGEINPESGHITVRQYDAHAWAEVWLEGKGWVSVDPTAEVAPQRIRLGLRDSLPDGDEFLPGNNFSLIKLSNFQLLNDLRLRLDELNYLWHQSVLNFNKDKQGSMLKDWFGRDALKKSLYWLAGLFCAFLLLISAILLWPGRKKKRTQIEKSLDSLNNKLSRYGLNRKEHEGLNDYSQRLQANFPHEAASIQRLFDQLQQHYYGDQGVGDEPNLTKFIKQMSKRLTKDRSNRPQ